MKVLSGMPIINDSLFMLLPSSDPLILVALFLFVLVLGVNESLARSEAKLVFGPKPLLVRKAGNFEQQHAARII